jgi:hypothetical protein
VDGSDAELAEVDGPEAIAEVLHGGDESRKTRLVVRGPGSGGSGYAGVDVGKDRASSWTERWTLELSRPAKSPWIQRSAGQSASAPLS